MVKKYEASKILSTLPQVAAPKQPDTTGLQRRVSLKQAAFSGALDAIAGIAKTERVKEIKTNAAKIVLENDPLVVLSKSKDSMMLEDKAAYSLALQKLDADIQQDFNETAQNIANTSLQTGETSSVFQTRLNKHINDSLQKIKDDGFNSPTFELQIRETLGDKMSSFTTKYSQQSFSNILSQTKKIAKDNLTFARENYGYDPTPGNKKAYEESVKTAVTNRITTFENESLELNNEMFSSFVSKLKIELKGNITRDRLIQMRGSIENFNARDKKQKEMQFEMSSLINRKLNGNVALSINVADAYQNNNINDAMSILAPNMPVDSLPVVNHLVSLIANNQLSLGDLGNMEEIIKTYTTGPLGVLIQKTDGVPLVQNYNDAEIAQFRNIAEKLLNKADKDRVSFLENINNEKQFVLNNNGTVNDGIDSRLKYLPFAKNLFTAEETKAVLGFMTDDTKSPEDKLAFELNFFQSVSSRTNKGDEIFAGMYNSLETREEQQLFIKIQNKYSTYNNDLNTTFLQKASIGEKILTNPDIQLDSGNAKANKLLIYETLVDRLPSNYETNYDSDFVAKNELVNEYLVGSFGHNKSYTSGQVGTAVNVVLNVNTNKNGEQVGGFMTLDDPAGSQIYIPKNLDDGQTVVTTNIISKVINRLADNTPNKNPEQLNAVFKTYIQEIDMNTGQVFSGGTLPTEIITPQFASQKAKINTLTAQQLFGSGFYKIINYDNDPTKLVFAKEHDPLNHQNQQLLQNPKNGNILFLDVKFFNDISKLLSATDVINLDERNEKLNKFFTKGPRYITEEKESYQIVSPGPQKFRRKRDEDNQ